MFLDAILAKQQRRFGVVDENDSGLDGDAARAPKLARLALDRHHELIEASARLPALAPALHLRQIHDFPRSGGPDGERSAPVREHSAKRHFAPRLLGIVHERTKQLDGVGIRLMVVRRLFRRELNRFASQIARQRRRGRRRAGR